MPTAYDFCTIREPSRVPRQYIRRMSLPSVVPRVVHRPLDPGFVAAPYPRSDLV
jgi:hypothetical protein